MKSSGFTNVKIIPRGYNEVHYHRASTHIKNSDSFTFQVIRGPVVGVKTENVFKLELPV